MTRHVLLAISLPMVFAVSVSAQEPPASAAQIPRAQELALSVLEVVSNEIERLTLRMQEGGEWNEDLGQSLAANMRIMALVVDDAFGEALEMAIAEVGGEDALAAEILRGDDFEGSLQALQRLQALGGGIQGLPMTEDEIREFIVRLRENGISDIFAEPVAGLGDEGSPDSTTDTSRAPTDPQRP